MAAANAYNNLQNSRGQVAATADTASSTNFDNSIKSDSSPRSHDSSLKCLSDSDDETKPLITRTTVHVLPGELVKYRKPSTIFHI